jgi:hypothetical protein
MKNFALRRFMASDFAVNRQKKINFDYPTTPCSDMDRQIPNHSFQEESSSSVTESPRFWNAFTKMRSQYLKRIPTKNDLLSSFQGRFEYVPLDPLKNEIRLLQILPTSKRAIAKSDCVNCRLFNISLDEQPEYEALSYTWGAQNDMCSILLNGYNFEISRNLEAALIKLRASTPRTLWVDAICIDQANDYERNHQVTKIRLIYAMTKRIHVWIGVGFNGSRLTFTLLKLLRGRIVDSSGIRSLLTNPSFLQHLLRLSELFTQEYFFRVWVTQEVVCAREAVVHCGTDSIGWSDLVAVQETIATNHFQSLIEADRHHPSPYLIQSFVFWGSRMMRLPKALDNDGLPELSGMLEQSYNKHTSDPRDHIYGIIGLTKARNDERLQIDYSTSVRQLFLVVCEYIISTSQKLDIICARAKVSLTFTSNDEFPSWVPDWTFNAQAPVLMPSNFSAAANTRGAFHCDVENGILLARGFCIDRIKEHGMKAEMTNWKDTKEAMRTFCGWHKLLRKQFKDPRSQWERFFRTLWMTEKEETVKSESMSAAEEIRGYCKKACPREYSDLQFIQSVPPREPGISKVSEKGFVDGIASYMYRRLFFISKNKTLGLGPDVLQKNDLICVLFGCKYPVILRYVEPYYYLVGPAYFEGYMWGRGIRELKESLYPVQYFEVH